MRGLNDFNTSFLWELERRFTVSVPMRGLNDFNSATNLIKLEEVKGFRPHAGFKWF